MAYRACSPNATPARDEPLVALDPRGVRGTTSVLIFARASAATALRARPRFSISWA